MNFQKIPPVERADTYVDMAIKQAEKAVSLFKQKLRREKNPVRKQAQCETQRLKEMAKSLQKSLGRITQEFPSIDQLPEFYLRLIESTLDREKLQGALASVNTAVKNIMKLSNELARKYYKVERKDTLLLLKRQAIGRISSIVNKLDKEFGYLDKARKAMRTYPAIKPDLFTVAIAGFPNVGKSTLLSKLTPSTPEISDYAFTTKKLNVGYLTHRHNKIQFIDTPGTLARPEKMNSVERQAYLAMKYVANLIIYVYDLTESYPLEEQRRLEEEVRKYGKELFLFVSKTDVLDKEIVATFVAAFTEGETCFTSVAALKEQLTAFFERDFLGLRK